MADTQIKIPDYSFPRYLSAKKDLDDRSLNGHVWDIMVQNIQPAAPGDPLQILEVGCGIGTMLDRLAERRIFEKHQIQFVYTGVDSGPENITHARQRYSQPPTLVFHPISFVLADLFSLPSSIQNHSFDLIIAHAFLDLVNVPRALQIILSYLRPGGVFYFTLNFDGETAFQPEHPLDSKIISCYHSTMDERQIDGYPSGDSHTGRHLLGQLKQLGADTLAAGSSDWVVFPGLNGYPGDEAYFLHHILHFFEQSLNGYSNLDPGSLATWLSERHNQVQQGELIYIAHQIDVVGKVL